MVCLSHDYNGSSSNPEVLGMAAESNTLERFQVAHQTRSRLRIVAPALRKQAERTQSP
jgi:hypothetical protein